MDSLEALVDRTKSLRTLRTVIFYAVVIRCGGKLLWALYDKGPMRLLRDSHKSLVVKFFSALRYLPFVQRKINSEMSKVSSGLRKSLIENVEGMSNFVELPPEGLTDEVIIGHLQQLRSMGHTHWEEGKVSGTVYHGGDKITRLSAQAYEMFIWSNPLHPDVFPGVRKMEAEIISMVVKMYNGDSEACGTTTSGGTESILMACKAYRDWALKVKGITQPEIVVPQSIHCAFDKAAHYFGIKIIHVPVEERTRRADVARMRAAITSNTVALACSVPNYPHGACDDVIALSRLAQDYNIGLHVDCCLGGFLVPFMAKAGYDIPPFDFSVPGVTSISCDTHKFGFAPKGSSVIMYR